MRSHCPHCDFVTEAENTDDLYRNERAHMEAAHQDVIEQRLVEAGFEWDESTRKWVDTKESHD
jgi:hypothetical protein